MLPQAAGARGDHMTFWRFDRAITQVSIADSATLTEPPGYACKRSGPRRQCLNGESHIDDVLALAAKSNPRELTIIVTDLWLTNTELAASLTVTLNLRFASLFQQGRSIGIVGIAAPYKGPVYDMPWGGTYLGATSRPLFVVLIGPAPLEKAYLDAIEAYSAARSAAFNPAHVHHSLFTGNPFVGTATLDARVMPTIVSDGFQPSAILTNPDFAHIQQFRLERSELLQRDPRQPRAMAVGTLVISARTLPGSVWSGSLAPSTRVWMLRDQDAVDSDTCNATTWTPFGTAPLNWPGAPETATRRQMSFSPGNDLISLPAGHTYFIATYLERTDVAAPNVANDWMRQWSFDLADHDSLIRRHPTFFPALNLSATASVLEATLQQANGARRVPIGGFGFVTQVED